MSEFYKEFEFKGIKLQPMSEGRRALMLSIMAEDSIGKIIRMHCAIYCLICDVVTARNGFRNINKFVDSAMEWADKNITEADYKEEGELIQKINDHADTTRAEPVEDDSLVADPPTGN